MPHRSAKGIARKLVRGALLVRRLRDHLGVAVARVSQNRAGINKQRNAIRIIKVRRDVCEARAATRAADNDCVSGLQWILRWVETTGKYANRSGRGVLELKETSG